MKNIDAKGHVRGESLYLDDLPELQGTLFAHVFDAPCAHARITRLDCTKAMAYAGVVKIYTYQDIKGENQIGGIFPDEPLLAEGHIHFWGQPIAVVVAETEAIARHAAKLIELELEILPIVTDPREARANNSLIFPPRTFRLGNPEAVWQKCAFIVEGRADNNGQEHLYIETNGAYAVPMENGHIRLSSSTQGPTAVQRTAARVLGIPMHQIEVDVTRLGGGFGGKEDQATPWAVMVAMAAHDLRKPVKMALHRMEDLRMTGKRHPYSSDYKLGLDHDYKILAYKATFHQNAGAAADLSPAVMERTLFHATNSYFIPNVEVTAFSCKTNLPPNTAFRGFGGPQGMFVMESAIAHAAHTLGVAKEVIQERNLLKEKDEFPYGQLVEGAEAVNSWKEANQRFAYEHLKAEVAAFNAANRFEKKGISVMPICFGISFTKTPMNNARALVHIYSDGSVGISTGAVEMGQGVNTKMVQVAAKVLGIQPSKVKIETTNTTRVANTSPSAASATADLNGKALEIACQKLLARLVQVAEATFQLPKGKVSIRNGQVHNLHQPTGILWEELVNHAFLQRVCLTENGHYATPLIHFDKETEKGHPFAYHVYGTAYVVAKVDCLRGRYTIEQVKVVHDYGQSMNPDVDLGQIEGGLVQGIGWMTMEEVAYNQQGKLLSNALSTYKIPDIYSIPQELTVLPLTTSGHDLAIMKSKAVGEPPLMYGIGAYFAIQQAVLAFNPKHTPRYDAPFTPEKVLMALYDTGESSNQPSPQKANS